MTPLHLGILLHYYTSGAGYDFAGNETRIHFGKDLFAWKLLELDADSLEPDTYCITDRGTAFIKHILELPLPTQQWVMP